MNSPETGRELRENLMAGMKKVWERLIEFKKRKGTEIVVLRDGKIHKFRPE